MRIPLISGDEQDALARSRHCHSWRRGEVKAIKRRVNRRERRAARKAIRAGREA